jgi:hypothetical protein
LSKRDVQSVDDCRRTDVNSTRIAALKSFFCGDRSLPAATAQPSLWRSR